MNDVTKKSNENILCEHEILNLYRNIVAIEKVRFWWDNTFVFIYEIVSVASVI